MAKLPAIQFYPGDWLRDPVAGCSLRAQGLWLRMMFLMHDSDRYGYLSVNGVPIPPDAIARRCSCDSLEQYTALLDELFLAGVPSKTNDGVIYCRRMVNDAKKRKDNNKRQSKHRERSNANITQDVTHLSHPSSSSVSSSPSGIKGGFKKPTLEEVKLACSKGGISEQDGEWFYHKCEGNGWTNGGNPIKRWWSTLKAWQTAGYLPSQKNSPAAKPAAQPVEESIQW